uniref:Leucine-rich repeat-containing N-terminal plant-type domain-containing protein n=1 Tax=Setaria digitata TaxID=48799 RepID=A0A915Q6F2_9BILA
MRALSSFSRAYLTLLYTLFHLFTVQTTTVPTAATITNSQCNAAFKQTTEINEPEACHCFAETVSSKERELLLSTREGFWIGCTRQKMPQVFSALNALNETMVSKLWIWDSLINIIPADMFAQVRPRILSIERSGLSLFRPGAFSKIGRRLQVLQLRNNIIKRIEPVMFKDLDRLEVLDLGGNKISSIITGELDRLKDLNTLILSDNQIANIENGAFASLSNLKTLNLANNKLMNISVGTFRGLNNLETLNLQSNNILFVDWNAFAQLKNLKYLNLGNNHISRVDLRGLKSLEKLFVNNNSIQSMKNITLRDLRSLALLSLDRNSITEILNGDLHSLGESVRLSTFSVAANNIAKIEARAFEPIHQITVLSLQNNQLISVASDDGTADISFLRPLKKLTKLYLSNNNLVRVGEHDFSALTSLKLLALDHNQIEEIHSRALNGLSLRRFYLNHNRLLYLPRRLLDDLNVEQLTVVDFSDNLWQCICGEEWLADWLLSIGDRNVVDGNMGCIGSRVCTTEHEREEEHSVWITVIASVLAVVSLLILIAIALLYVEDGRRMKKLSYPLRRVPLDLRQLIPNGSTTSLPSENGIEPLLTCNTVSIPKEPLLNDGQLRLSTCMKSALIVPNHTDNNIKISNNGNINGSTGKKRVRFNNA